MKEKVNYVGDKAVQAKDDLKFAAKDAKRDVERGAEKLGDKAWQAK